MREEFEKLPEVSARLQDVVFDVGSGEYLPKKMGYIVHEFSAHFLKGSWYVYQTQQAKIEKLKRKAIMHGVSEEYLK